MNDKKVKILYAITKGNFGGAQRYVYDLAVELPKEKFEAVVAMGEGAELEKKLGEAGVRTLKISSLTRDVSFAGDLKSFFQFLKIVRKERPNVVHLNSSKMGGIGGFAVKVFNAFFRPKKSAPVKIIFTGHGWAFNEQRGWMSKKIILLAHWVTIILSDVTIAVSEKTKSDFDGLPFAAKKIKTVHNGLGTVNFKTREEARAALAPKIADKIWIGTISELHKNKGVDLAIESFSKISPEFPDAFLVIVGDGEEKENLERLVKSKGLEEKIVFCGRVENGAEYLKAFDIFSLTSRTEAFPYVILEAGQAGLPILASSVGGIPEMIKTMQNGILVRAGNTKDISGGMKYLLENPDKAAAFGANAKKEIAEEFGLQKMISRTVEIYLSPLGKSPEQNQLPQKTTDPVPPACGKDETGFSKP